MWKNIAHEESESTYISLKHKQLNGVGQQSTKITRHIYLLDEQATSIRSCDLFVVKTEIKTTINEWIKAYLLANARTQQNALEDYLLHQRWRWRTRHYLPLGVLVHINKHHRWKRIYIEESKTWRFEGAYGYSKNKRIRRTRRPRAKPLWRRSIFYRLES
jgi:hypothetical protein